MRIAICTLGCKVNQYETQAIEQELLRRGHSLVDFEDEADAYIVNTCSVTAISDKKSRQMLRRARTRNPAAVIAACGCYAQTHPDDVKALAVDVLAGTNDRGGFLIWWSARRRKRRASSIWTTRCTATTLKSSPPGAWRHAPVRCSRWRTAA